MTDTEVVDWGLEWPSWMFGEDVSEKDFLALGEAFQLVSAALRGEQSYRDHVKMMASLEASIGRALDDGEKKLDVSL